MGIVVDFIAFVLGRPKSRVPGRSGATPFASFDKAAFQNALSQLDHAHPSEVLAFGAGLAASCLTYGHDRRRVAEIAMQAHPDAAWILCFDGDGHMREAALRRLSASAVSTGRFVALALRLNDWVPQVRSEAAATIRRVWPQTPPEVIAGAAPYLLRQRFAWRRWTSEAACVDEVLSNAKVAQAVSSLLLDGQSGPLGSTLGQALRFPTYERGLAKLAIEARLPDVRAVAMRTLLSGKATWPVGRGWTWVDKSMGERRRVVLTESRQVSAPEPPDLLEAGLADRSALVRKVAADAVIERMNALANIGEIAARLADDKSAAVRDRASFIHRHLNAPVT